MLTRGKAALPDTAPRWLLAPSRERLGGPLEQYLLQAEALGVQERFLVKQRTTAGRPWWKVEADFEAPILFSYFNRKRPRFVRNRVGGVPLNNWLVIQPHRGIDPDALFAALSEPAVRNGLENDSRRYGNGLWKLEPSELKRLRLTRDREALRRRRPERPANSSQPARPSPTSAAIGSTTNCWAPALPRGPARWHGVAKVGVYLCRT